MIFKTLTIILLSVIIFLQLKTPVQQVVQSYELPIFQNTFPQAQIAPTTNDSLVMPPPLLPGGMPTFPQQPVVDIPDFIQTLMSGNKK